MLKDEGQGNEAVCHMFSGQGISLVTDRRCGLAATVKVIWPPHFWMEALLICLCQ